MNGGFPLPLVSSFRCTADGAPVVLGDNSLLSQDGRLVRSGTVCCRSCGAAYPIDDGILNLLDAVALDEESRYERQRRDEHARSVAQVAGTARTDDEHDAMEMLPTLEALAAGRDMALLELGCGDGRYTVRLAGACRWIVAVDFSLESLRVLQRRLHGEGNVALVLGDVSTMKVTPAAFDRVLSTLASNLPTRECRDAMYRLAARALRREGRFVFSTHHHGCRQRLKGLPQSGRYEGSGIYRYNFTVGECEAEVRPFFDAVRAKPIQISLPFARRLGVPLLPLSRFLERVPLINRLGWLVLCSAERPR